jgi:hypothetical protein
MAVLFLIIWGASILFSIVVMLIYIPSNSIWGFFFPTSSPAFVVFLMIAILTKVRWNLKVVFTSISFMTKDAEHISCIYWPFVHVPLRMSVQFIGLLILVNSVFWASCKFLLLIPCQMYSWQIFSHFMLCHFSLVTISYAVQKLFSFMQSHLLILFLNCWATGALFRKSFPIHGTSVFLILSFCGFIHYIFNPLSIIGKQRKFDFLLP